MVRCSGASVFLTPSHVKESFTAAIVVRSLWAALGEVCVAGLLVGWVVVRRELVWLVVGSVVIAVGIGTCDLLEGWLDGRPGGADWWRHGLGKPSGW